MNNSLNEFEEISEDEKQIIVGKSKMLTFSVINLIFVMIMGLGFLLDLYSEGVNQTNYFIYLLVSILFVRTEYKMFKLDLYIYADSTANRITHTSHIRNLNETIAAIEKTGYRFMWDENNKPYFKKIEMEKE